jgi:predicted nucleotidyltransferase component of viral defense system
MDRNSNYYKQVQLLVQLLPLVAEEECFALKGGTAINMFIRNLPRLSVDIDLVYLPTKNRGEALNDIKAALSRISQRISKVFTDVKVIETFQDKADSLRLIVSRQSVQIKIELSPVLRGTVFSPQLTAVCEAVENEFGYAEIPVVSLADLYAGKICAALDRQHPRDLFDIKGLLETEGVTVNIRRALIVYMISHNRPMAELLRPQLKDISGLYEGEFANMTEDEASLEELETARKSLIEIVNTSLKDDEKRFLLSFKNKSPDWSLLGLKNIGELPAVKWKLINLTKMPSHKHAQAYQKLSDILNVED